VRLGAAAARSGLRRFFHECGARPIRRNQWRYSSLAEFTAIDRPEFPDKGFVDLGGAREWGCKFVHWYNHNHCHSGIRYVSPVQRHDGADVAILAARHDVYLKSRQRNPARWSRHTRDWSHVTAVTLNPERESVVTAASRSRNTQPLAA